MLKIRKLYPNEKIYLLRTFFKRIVRFLIFFVSREKKYIFVPDDQKSLIASPKKALAASISLSNISFFSGRSV
jgi:hypothetical protein